MNIRANRYNDPALGAAFENIASLFAPPSAQDTAAYATAKAKREEAERAARMFAYANDPSYSRDMAERMAFATGLVNGTNGYYAQDQNNATTIRGQDLTAETSRANNLADNQRATITSLYASQAPDYSRPTVPGNIAGVVSLPELPAVQGSPKPLSETEQLALERQQLRERGALTDEMLIEGIRGAEAPVKVAGPNGPVYQTPGGAIGMPAYVDAGSQPTSVQEYEYARQQGFAGTYDEWVTAKAKAGASNIQMGADGKLGPIPAGYQAVADPTSPTGIRMAPVPGGPADKQAQRVGNAGIASDVVNTATERALSADGERILGNVFGMLASYVPGTANSEVYKQVDVLKSNATIEALNAMRAASPTGGALGSVTDRENAMLAAKAGMLDPASPNFQRDLSDYQRTLLRTIHGSAEGDRIFAGQVAARANGGAVAAPPAAAPAANVPPAPAGVDPALWEFMTPEERALFQ